MCCERRRSRSGCSAISASSSPTTSRSCRARGRPRSATRARRSASSSRRALSCRGERLRELGQRRPAPQRQGLAQQPPGLLGVGPPTAPAGRRPTERSKAGRGRARRLRPRAGSPEDASAAAVPEAPCAAARRGSAPSSAPIPAPPRPTARRRSGRGTRCGSRAAAGSASSARCLPAAIGNGASHRETV